MSDDPSKTKVLFDGPAGELPAGAELSGGMYRVTNRIAAGGFGITYEARDNLDRKVAIKECFPAGLALRAGDFTVSAASASTSEPFETARNLFLREARTLAVLRHPNIVHVQTLFEENGTAYMAMDYIDGRDLQEVIDTDPGLLTPAYVMELTRALLGALDYLHRDAPAKGKERLLHRDIKPANIRIDPLDTPVIIDFGAARQETKKQSRAAGTFRVVSDGYSPNEFYVAGTEQGPASDLYSLAATLHHCITGAAPAPADERAQKVSNGEDDPYEPIAGRFPGHDPRLLALIDRALARPMKDRPADAAAWFAAIPDATTRIVEPDETPATPIATPPPPPGSSGFWKGAALGGVALALLGGGAVALAPGLLPAGGGDMDEMRRQLDEARGSATEMSGTIEMLEARIREAEELRSAAADRADDLEARVSDLREQLDAAAEGDDAQMATLREQLAEAEAAREEADAALAAMEQDFEDLQLELTAALSVPTPEVTTIVSARDAAQAEASRLEAEVARLRELLDGGDATAQLEEAIEARDRALRDVDRARSDLRRMAEDLSEAEAEANRLHGELRTVRAEIELARAAAATPNPGPNTSGATGSAAITGCPSFADPGPGRAFTGPEIFSTQALQTVGGGGTALTDCAGLPGNVSGFTDRAPNYTLELSEMSLFERLQINVTAEGCDPTLLVNTADAAWHFNDNANDSLLPELNLTGAEAIEGRIDVWVGTLDGRSCDATVHVASWLN
ncbi:protein kinase [Gymnodinialimonas sp. 2305UL16-5]|uniref:protein kinase domain-containing protein n=1 Tax=Gymnodinialimonas mytili TaxID=3126503 RepID=UPI0030A6E948